MWEAAFVVGYICLIVAAGLGVLDDMDRRP